MLLFGLGKLLYVIILLTNAIAVLSEDRFLARIGWGRTQAEPGFGHARDESSIKAKTIHLIASVRTVMRGTPIAICLVLELGNYRYILSMCWVLVANELVTVPLIAINIIIIVYELILG
ncbi:hypothetical protein KEM54_004094 [Ascosphaera aggregata]|nr:hypothetical protein KEM54_004094 [Ascosphaera aggregata]